MPRPRPPFRLRRVIIALLFIPFLDLLACWSLAPATWQWTRNNLQVRLHNDANLRAVAGSAGCSAGWSKLSLALGDWGRAIGEGTWGSGKTVIHDECSFHIVSVNPWSVSVRIRYRQDTNGEVVTFDRVLDVPAHQPARLNISPDLYVTAEFE